MALFENFPYTNFHELNLDWIIKEFTQFKTDYENMPEFIQDAINQYIDEHPDYNVHDESLTSRKLDKNSIPFYNVADYGIYPDSGDVYVLLHDLFKDMVYNTGGIVFFPKGKYIISYTLFIPENTMIIGEGSDTEIYFNEADSNFGTAFCNAGSNISICNIKISQATSGVFTPGSQPGCIGITNIAPAQVLEPIYSHIFIRNEEAKNITVKNVTFAGFYAFQIEPGANSAVRNVSVSNIIAEGCVSIQANGGATIENVHFENIVCDVLRVSAYGPTHNISYNNVITKSIFQSKTYEQSLIHYNNIRGISAAKQNTLGEAKYVFSGSFSMTNSTLDEEANVTFCEMYGGIHYLYNCMFNAENMQFIKRMTALNADSAYEVMYNCIIHNENATLVSNLLGYGSNNRIYGTNINNLLFGNCYKKKSIPTQISSSLPSLLECIGDQVHLRISAVLSAQKICDLPTWFNLPIDTPTVLVTVWDYNTPTYSRTTWAKIENGEIVITDTGITISNFNRALVDCIIPLTAIPNPVQMYSSFS